MKMVQDSAIFTMTDQ